MVRAHMKQSSEEKKEVHKKKPPSKKKTQETGVWPCKINGCNKEFAREADLKRHQRTTKLHSLPGLCVSCPQCEATFTRTDALRRHQKSRHNGVILDPIEQGKGGEDDGGSGESANQSRSGTPARGKGKKSSSTTSPATSTAPVPTVLARPDTAGPASGAQSYYRPHTVNPVFVPPRTPHGILDTPSYQAGTQLPMSATRLHGANWPPAPPWIQQDGGNAQRPAVSYPVMTQGHYYPPGAYYRSANGQPALGPGTATHHQLDPAHMQAAVGGIHGPGQEPHTNGSGAETSSTAPLVSNSNIDPNLGDLNTVGVNDSETQRKGPDATSYDQANINDAVQKALQAVLAIDPSLNATIPNLVSQSHPNHTETNSVANSMQPNHNLLSAAVLSSSNARLDSTSHPNLNPQTDTGQALPANITDMQYTQLGQAQDSLEMISKTDDKGYPRDGDAEMDVDADGEADIDGEGEMDGPVSIEAVNMQRRDEDSARSSHHHHTGQMLTEDGEPMLRPDELLNEESLASPPPF